MKQLIDAYYVDPTDKRYTVKVYSGLQNKEWGMFWGRIQKQLFTVPQLEIAIDLTECDKADPFPLMSVTIDLLRLHDRGKKILIFLKKIGNNDKKSFSYRSFLKLLATQGILTKWIEKFEVKEGNTNINAYRIEKISSFGVGDSYCGSLIIPYSFFNCSDGFQKEKVISGIMDSFQIQFKDKVSIGTYKRLAEYIFQVLVELIENIERHAYEESSKSKFFGIYIRERKGIVGEDRERDDIKYEKNNCPALNINFFQEYNSFIEIFVSDSGMGLSESLTEYFRMIKGKNKYPIRSLFYKVLKEGIRKTPQNALTTYGGLHFLCRLLRESRGYIWCNEGNEWVGASSQTLLKYTEDNIDAAITLDMENNVQKTGLNWGIRIPAESNENNLNILGVLYNLKGQDNPIKNIYYQSNITDEYSGSAFCIEEAYRENINISGKWYEWKSQILEPNKNVVPNNCDELIWIPQENYSKNAISTKIKALLSNISEVENICLIIGDISTNSFLGFYYALNELDLKEKEINGLLSKVILITNRWEIAILINRQGVLKQENQTEVEYYKMEGKSLSESLFSYANVRRLIDSYLLWEKVLNSKREKVFINAEIKWGTSPLDGYLDIERLFQDETVLSMVEKSLMRLIGFFPNSSVEFVGIDETVFRVCNDLNLKQGEQKETLIRIGVCGAVVTGYTQATGYNGEEHEQAVLFMRNKDLNIPKVMILYLWPDKNYLNQIKRETDTYHRIGKTSLITSKNEKDYLSNNYLNVVKSKKDMYSDLQKKYPQFVKYGHFKTDNHHYLIGFDLIKYMNYSFMKKEGAFLFFLWKVLFFLSGSADKVNENIERIEDPEWRKALKDKKFRRDPLFGGIVLYHYNSFTDFVMQKITKILPNDLSDRIIPTNLYNIQKKGSSMFLSPFVSDSITDQISYNDGNILFIDSSYSTGRKMLEINNVLKSINGVGKVFFFSMMDLRRLRNDDPTVLAYWKVDVPRLDDDGSCVICDTLTKIKRFQKRLTEKYKKRVQEWRENWDCINIGLIKSGHGIERTSISPCVFEIEQGGGRNVELNISDTDLLNLYATESLCDLYNNEFVYNLYTKQKTDLQHNQRIQLICTQLLLFGNQNSRQLQLTLLCELIKYVSCSSKNSNYTSLASIVLFSQKPEVIFETLKSVICGEKKYFLDLKEKLLQSNNMDLIITLSYFTKNSYEIEHLLSGYQKEKNIHFNLIDKMNEVVIPSGKLLSELKEFQGMLVNEMGSRHNTSIQKITQEPNYENIVLFEKQCRKVIYDVDRMVQLAQGFPLSNATFRGGSEMHLDELDSLSKKLQISLNEDINMYKEGVIDGPYHISDNSYKLLDQCRKIFDEVLLNYFIEYNESTESYFSSLINKAEEEYNKKIELKIIQNTIKDADYHKYYYWTQGIEKEFEYLIDNLHNCEDPVKENIMMEVEIVFTNNALLIKSTSWSEKSAFAVKDAFKNKNRLSKEQAIALEVEFDFENTEERFGKYSMLISKMSVPAVYKKIE